MRPNMGFHTFLILRSPSLSSFLYPKVPRVNVFRSLSCSQPIRQRIRRRTFTLYFNSQILVFLNSRIIQRELLSPLRKTPRLQRSRLSSSEAKFHSVVTNLSHQCRRAPPRDWVATAVHEEYDLVNMFLSSKSLRRFGLSHQTSRCTFQWDKVEFTKLAHSLGQMLRCFSKIQSVLGKVMKVLNKQICILLHPLYSESDSVFRLTPICLAVSLVVTSLFSCSNCTPILMMSGACLKSSQAPCPTPVQFDQSQL